MSLGVPTTNACSTFGRDASVGSHESRMACLLSRYIGLRLAAVCMHVASSHKCGRSVLLLAALLRVVFHWLFDTHLICVPPVTLFAAQTGGVLHSRIEFPLLCCLDSCPCFQLCKLHAQNLALKKTLMHTHIHGSRCGSAQRCLRMHALSSAAGCAAIRHVRQALPSPCTHARPLQFPL
jgi:hypothetical protein